MGAPRIVDCHCHIIDPERYPFASRGGYRPRPDEIGTREAFAAQLDLCGVSHALLVQPSSYGTDNCAALDTVAWKPQRFRMIGVVEPDISERGLEKLKAQGLVGVRFNLQFNPDILFLADKSGLLARLKEQECFVQVHGLEKDWTGAVSILRKANLKVIIDHMGLERAESGVDQKGFQAVMGLSQDSDVVIKLSAFVRSSRDTRLFEDLDPFVAMVLKHFGVARCVWGSDWPFLGAFPRPDYVEMLAPLARWIPDQSDYRAILWNNPQRLFGFGDERL